MLEDSTETIEAIEHAQHHFRSNSSAAHATPGQLDRRFAALHTRVHGQNLVVTKQARDVLLILPQRVCTAGEQSG